MPRSFSKRLGAGMIVLADMKFTFHGSLGFVRCSRTVRTRSLVRFHPTFGSEKLKEYFGHISSARFVNLAPTKMQRYNLVESTHLGNQKSSIRMLF